MLHRSCSVDVVYNNFPKISYVSIGWSILHIQNDIWFVVAFYLSSHHWNSHLRHVQPHNERSLHILLFSNFGNAVMENLLMLLDDRAKWKRLYSWLVRPETKPETTRKSIIPNDPWNGAFYHSRLAELLLICTERLPSLEVILVFDRLIWDKGCWNTLAIWVWFYAKKFFNWLKYK